MSINFKAYSHKNGKCKCVRSEYELVDGGITVVCDYSFPTDSKFDKRSIEDDMFYVGLVRRMNGVKYYNYYPDGTVRVDFAP